MLTGPLRDAQTALACVWTTAFGREVVPEVNMMPAGSIGSAGALRQRRRVAEQVGEGHEPVDRLAVGRGGAAVVLGDDDPLQLRARSRSRAPRTAAA